jgi:uncharacterized delta-60 repeat protein
MKTKRFFTVWNSKIFVSALLLTAIAVYASPGDLDLTFNQTGYSVSAFGGGNDYGLASARQSDGKIVVAGHSSHGQTTVFSAARYNPDGSLDAGFGLGGKAHTSFGATAYGSPGISGCWAQAVAIQADGKIVLAGAVNYRNEQFGPAWSDIALVRYNADGSLDTTFDGDGKVRTSVFANSTNAAYTIAIGNDGKIVVAGRGQPGGMVVVRYNSDGSLDNTFDSDGKFTTLLGGYATDAVVQPDGKIVVTGPGFSGGSTDYVTIRLNTAGTLDTSFNGTGIAPTPAVVGTHNPDALALQPDGKIIVAGQWNDPGGVALMRYNPDGTFDSSFGAGGFLNFGYFTYEGSATDLALQPDGKIVIAGSIDRTPNGLDDSDFIVFRFNSNGSVDNTFNGSGSLSTSLGKGDDRVTGAHVQPDGKIVLTGYLYQPGQSGDFALVRYNPNGPIDQSFGTGGKVISDVGFGGGYANDMVIQSDDKIVVVGGNGSFAVARYRTDGTPDPAFNGTGTAQAFAPDSEAKAVAVQADGKILVAGRTRNGGTDDAAVTRLNADGSVDETFGDQGRIVTPIGILYDSFEAIAVQPDGRIVTAGYARSVGGQRTDLAMLRYTADGVPDLSFGDNGRVVGGPCGHSDSSVAGLEIQTGGKIVASGECGGLAVFRFNPDGSPDTSFNKTGAAVIGSLQTSGSSSDVGIQNDGKIVVAGRGYVNGGNAFILARYDPNGSLDPSFNGSGIVTRSTGTGDDQAMSLAIQPDGKLIAAGYGTNGGMSEFIVLRLNTDGTVDSSWGNSGAVSIGFDGDSYANAAAIDSMGRVLVGGNVGGLFGVARLKSDTAPVSFASVSGRVLDASGQPVSRATVSKTDSAGAVRTAQANPFGYYRFDGVRTGETYTFMAMAKRFRFSPRVVTIGGDLTDLNLIAN